MSHLRKLSHAIWHCQYHTVWVPKYRYRVLTGPVGKEVYTGSTEPTGVAGRGPCLPPLGASTQPLSEGPKQSHVLWAWFFTFRTH